MSESEEQNFDRMVRDLQALIEADARTLYSEKVIREFNNPSNLGRMTDADACGVVPGTCGDTIEIYIKVKEGSIKDLSFMTDGCGATIACASITTRMAKGKTLEEASKITGDNLIYELGGLPDEHLHCAHLAVAGLKKAIGNYIEK